MSYAAGSGPTGPGLVALIVLLALLIGLSVAVGCILLFRDGQPARRVRRSTAQRRLDEQFARGQIDEKEYLRLSAELTEQRSNGG
jgi:uncharacterized membrane protein